jgi:uncharacterized protein (DUF1697 family)
MISLLRGVNVGGHHIIRMGELRELYESLGLRLPQTYVQSGNVVFGTREKNTARLAQRIEDALEKHFGFRPEVILRTLVEAREVVSRNPFAKRRGLDPAKLVVTFLGDEPSAETRRQVLAIDADPEEMHFLGRELYVYFPNGMGKSKVWPAITAKLKKAGTARNWNTVLRLLEMAETVEQATSE